MKEIYTELSTYLLIKRYQEETDKTSAKAIELEKLIHKDLNIPDNIDIQSHEIQDKLNNFIKTEKKKHEKFINVTAWIFIILTGLKLLGSGCGLMVIGSTKKYLPKLNLLFLKNLGPFFVFVFQHLVLITIAGFILSIAMFGIAIAVLNRSNLARKLGILFLIYQIIRAIVSPFLVLYVFPSIRNLNEVPSSIMNSMYRTSIGLTVFFSIIFITVYSWLIYKYTRPEIKEEFK